MKVSVIIPTLNESQRLRKTLPTIGNAAEVIVADGGSTDGTRDVAAGLGARVVRTAPGRGLQMDAGASVAGGDVLVFLHADTRLPERWLESIEEALEDKLVVAGGFTLSVDSPGALLRLVEWFANARSRLFKVLYGDQAMFVRKEVFLSVGGFRRLPLLEDVDCGKRLKKAGRVVLLKDRVLTSPRRWERTGVVRNTALNGAILALYYLGVPPERLYNWYYK